MSVDVFIALSNQKRIQILSLLVTKSYSVTEISKKMGLSIQSLSPHIEQLEENKIVYRKNKRLSLTGIGIVLLEQINHFEFLANARNFFVSHSFGEMDNAFQHRLGELKKFELVGGLTPNITRWKQIISSAKDGLFCIFTEPPILIADEIISKLSNGIRLYLIFGNNSIVTNCNDFIDKLQLAKHAPQDIIQKRRVGYVGINIIQSESMASLMFPEMNGNTDMRTSFVSDDKLFLNWCRDYFHSKWNDSEPISRLKLTN